MTAVASEGVPGTRHELRQRLRSTVLGPRGGGTTRRRASDAFRLALAVIVVLVSIPVMRANSAAELSLVRAVHPPPAAISWLVTSVFWLGSAGVIVLLVVVGLLVPRLTAVRWTAVAGVLTWGVCALLGVILGSAAGRPPADALAGLNTDYPVTQLAVAVAVAATALPYLSRPVHRVVSLLVTLAVLAGVCSGEALPVNAVSSVALGWGIAAALHLAVGSPLGLPSAAEITEWITDLQITARDVTRAPRQVWGVELFTGRDETGKPIELSVYGRDASDARVLAKLWRFCLYRDSGPTLILDRLQQVEHEAYLTLMAGRAGLLVPDVLAAGRFGPRQDAALVSRMPDGPALSQTDGAGLADATLDEILRAALRLREARIEVPKLAEAKRVSWPNLLFAVGSLLGIWLIIGVLSDAGDSLDAIKGASWGWVALAFVFAQLPVVAEGWALLGAATGQLPYGRCVALETSNTFTALVGGNVAVFALRVRFFQRQGYGAEAAVSAGAIASTASWTVKTLLFLIALPFAAGSFHAPSGSGGDHEAAVWIVLAVILAAGIAAALVALVPRLRRLVSRARRPRRRRGRPDRRAHQRRHTPGPGRRGRAHPAVLHLLLAPGLGLGDAGLDAAPRIRVTREGQDMKAGLCFLLTVTVLVLFSVLRTLGLLGPPRYAWVSVSMLTAALALIAWATGATWADLGLERQHLRPGLLYGAGAFGLVLLVLVVAAVIPATNGFLHDSRAQISGSRMLYELVVSILLLTAIPEEFAFRGVLLGSALKLWGPMRASLITSVLFGLWHIAPTLHTMKDNRATAGLSASVAGQVLVVLGSIAVTFVAGLIFCWLRLRSRSLIAPVMAHFATNGLALAVAWFTVHHPRLR